MAANPEKRAELFDHLAELRTRLIRCALYVAAGMVVAWFAYAPIYALLTRQLGSTLKGGQLVFTTMAEPFMLRLQVSLTGGLLVALPMLMFEIWGFVAPGLTPREKRPLRWTVPLAVFLFACGAALGYWVLPAAFTWFASFKTADAQYMVTLPNLIRFELLMVLAFGCAFELPIILMLLAQVGVVNAQMLKTNWRYAMVIIAIAAASLTPGNDVFSMVALTVPLMILYVLSIYLVRFTEKKPKSD